MPGLLSTAPVTRHCVWLDLHSRNHSNEASTHALLPAACSRGSRLRRSPGTDASPPAAPASALPFPRPSCPGVPWLLSPMCTPRRLQRDIYTWLHTELTSKQASHLPSTALGYLQSLPWPQQGLQARKPGPPAAQDTGASASPAPMATVKASPQATTVTFIAWSPTTRWGTRLLREELVPSCPCWLLPKV